MRKFIYLVVSLLVFALFAQSGRAGGMTAEERVEQIAREYLAQHYPVDAPIWKYETIIIERAEVWVVSFRPKGEAVTGGAPEIFITKNDFKILGVRPAQ